MKRYIEIDDALWERALKLSGAGERETVEEGLKLLIEVRNHESFWEAFGKAPLESDFDKLTVEACKA